MNKKILKKIIYGILLVGWMTVIFCFSHQSSESSKKLTSDIASQAVDTLEKVEGEVFQENTVFEEENHWEWVDKIFTPLRKVAHIFIFFIYGFLLFNFLKEFNLTFKELIVASILLCLLYATGDEFHQSFIPGRAGIFMDVVIDTLGAFMGMGLCLIFNKKLYIKNKHSI